MAVFRPFKAYRPEKSKQALIPALPYDVMNSDEARELVKDLPYSFLHVDKAEVDLPRNIDIYDDAVYKKANEAGHSIPLVLQALEVVLYIVKSVGVGVEGKSPIHFAVAGNLIHTLKVPVEPLVVVIIPQAAFFPFIPRQGAEHLTTAGKLVKCKLAFKQGVVLQDNTHIVDGGFNGTRLGVFFKQHHPIFRLLALISGDAVKVLNGTFVPLPAFKACNICKPAG